MSPRAKNRWRNQARHAAPFAMVGASVVAAACILFLKLSGVF